MSVKTKDKIKNGLNILISETKDIHKITVKMLVDKININRSTFYLHYHDLNEVAEEIMNGIMDDIFKPYESSSTLDDIYSLLNYSINYIEQNNKDLFTYIYLDRIELVLIKFQKKAFDIIYNSKIITKYNDSDLMYCLQFYLDGFLNSIITSIKKNDFENTKNHAINLFNKIFL